MSIFDHDSPFDRLPWLQEKALRALQEAARLADLAAEPDTSAWYAKELRLRAAALAGRLVPVCALLYGAGQEAAKYDEWKGIVESGSFGLAGWCKRWDIADPAMIGRASLVEEREQDEVEAKGVELSAGLLNADDPEGLSLRVQIYSGTMEADDQALREEMQRLVAPWLRDQWVEKEGGTGDGPP